MPLRISNWDVIYFESVSKKNCFWMTKGVSCHLFGNKKTRIWGWLQEMLVLDATATGGRWFVTHAFLNDPREGGPGAGPPDPLAGSQKASCWAASHSEVGDGVRLQKFPARNTFTPPPKKTHSCLNFSIGSFAWASNLECHATNGIISWQAWTFLSLRFCNSYLEGKDKKKTVF